jgi:acyl carrier protein
MQVAISHIQEEIISLIEETVQAWELELDQPIESATKLIEDLSFASIDFIQLIVAIEEHFEQKLGFHDLLMPNGKYIDDLSVAELVSFINTKLNSPSISTVTPIKSNQISSNHTERSISTPQEKLNVAKIAQFKEIVPSPPQRKETVTTKNKKAVFILCSPRSGSTLLRVILAGHPLLFAPPELHLLSYNNLADRKAALSNEMNNHLLEGSIRAIMQLKSSSGENAQKLMEELENQQLTTKEFYHLLQEWLGDKILLDKTPTYGSHVDILRRAETDFDNPLYIHLVRHPYGMMRSYEDAKLDRIVPFMHRSSFTRRELAELTWLISQQNIVEFLQEVPQERQFRVRFEDLVQESELTVNNICNFLGLEFYEDMLDPYKEKEQRMTDGVNVASRFSGDLKFHLHQAIEAEAAERWKNYQEDDFLSDETREVAKLFGYGE